MTVAALLAVVQRDWRLNGRRSLRGFHTKAKHLLKHFARMKAADITTARVEEFKDARLSEGAARQTINNDLALLRRAFNLALRQELVRRAPHIKALSVNNVREGFVSPAEFRRLVATLDVLDPAVADAMRWGFLLGWRRQEVLTLRWEDVDIEAGVVHLPSERSKNREARRVKLSAELVAVLRRRALVRDCPLVFHRRGRRIKDFRGTWSRAVAALGKPDLQPRDLRRSFAHAGIQAGIHTKVLMAIAGWRTASVFYRYAIVDESLMEKALERISGLLWEEGKSS